MTDWMACICYASWIYFITLSWGIIWDIRCSHKLSEEPDTVSIKPNLLLQLFFVNMSHCLCLFFIQAAVFCVPFYLPTQASQIHQAQQPFCLISRQNTTTSVWTPWGIYLSAAAAAQGRHHSIKTTSPVESKRHRLCQDLIFTYCLL